MYLLSTAKYSSEHPDWYTLNSVSQSYPSSVYYFKEETLKMITVKPFLIVYDKFFHLEWCAKLKSGLLQNLTLRVSEFGPQFWNKCISFCLINFMFSNFIHCFQLILLTTLEYDGTLWLASQLLMKYVFLLHCVMDPSTPRLWELWVNNAAYSVQPLLKITCNLFVPLTHLKNKIICEQRPSVFKDHILVFPWVFSEDRFVCITSLTHLGL